MGRGTGDGGDVYRCQSAIFNRDPREISNTTKEDDLNTTPIPLHEHPLLASLGGFGPMFSAHNTDNDSHSHDSQLTTHTALHKRQGIVYHQRDVGGGGGGRGGGRSGLAVRRWATKFKRRVGCLGSSPALVNLSLTSGSQKWCRQ